MAVNELYECDKCGKAFEKQDTFVIHKKKGQVRYCYKCAGKREKGIMDHIKDRYRE